MNGNVYSYLWNSPCDKVIPTLRSAVGICLHLTFTNNGGVSKITCRTDIVHAVKRQTL